MEQDALLSSDIRETFSALIVVIGGIFLLLIAIAAGIRKGR